MRTFTCADCGGTFDSEQEDAVAQQEALDRFGRRGDAPEMVIVCDECYQAILSDLQAARDTVRGAILVDEAGAALIRQHLALFEREVAQALGVAMRDAVVKLVKQ
jgi:NAD-dependent SIR2 family protein deacetylase